MSEGSGQSVARATAGGGPRPIFVPSLTASVKRQRCLLHLSEDVSLPLADYFMIILCRIGPVCFFLGSALSQVPLCLKSLWHTGNLLQDLWSSWHCNFLISAPKSTQARSRVLQALQDKAMTGRSLVAFDRNGQELLHLLAGERPAGVFKADTIHVPSWGHASSFESISSWQDSTKDNPLVSCCSTCYACGMSFVVSTKPFRYAQTLLA